MTAESREVSGLPGAADRTHADAAAHALLLICALTVAWFPIESRPLTAVVVAAIVVGLSTWGWRRSSPSTVSALIGAAAIFLVLLCSGLSGWDPARAVGIIGLVAAVASLLWLGSRSRPPDLCIGVLATGLAGLALWGVWQVTTGLDSLAAVLDTMPEQTRRYAAERIAGGRASASLPLPSHLAVLLATALPLLVSRVRASVNGIVAAMGVVLAVIGLALTRSPVGIGLALAAVVAVVLGRNRRVAAVVVTVLGLVLVGVVLIRPDVTRLEPVALRFDNWRTAVWLWSTSPGDGAGVASFAQASQAAPLVVGNRPAHAHNLVLEALAELGPAGLTGCLMLGLVLVVTVRRLWPVDRALAVALVVVPLHNLVDFSSFVSSVAVPWAVLMSWGLARTRSTGPESTEVRGRLALVVVVAVGLGLTVLHATSVIVENAAAFEPDAAERFAGAERSLRLAPWRVEPQFLVATAALESDDGDRREIAWSLLDTGRRWRPRSAALAERRSQLALARGDASMTLAELWSARRQRLDDPALERRWTELVSHLENPNHAGQD